MNKIALSFDIEDWYHTPAISGASFSLYKNLDDFQRDRGTHNLDCITEETLRILEILDDLQIKATFFMVADVALRYSKITEALKKTDHEIGVHSLTHQSAIDSTRKILLQSKDEWLKDQKYSKAALEKIFNKEIIGYRAPNAYFANWMVPMLSELGFKYDSSIVYNSFYNKTNVKLKNIPSKPYRLNSVKLDNIAPDTELYELPWSYYKLNDKIALPGGGAFFFRLLGLSYFKKVIEQALTFGDTMFYLHPLDISTKKIPLSNNKYRPFFWINKGEKTEKKLIKLLNEYKERYTTCKAVYERNAIENE